MRAEDYARLGWHVLPLIPGKKAPYVKWDQATSDPAAAAELFARYPGAEVGVLCGPSKLAVVDRDVYKPEYRPVPLPDVPSWRMRSPRGGWQDVYHDPDGTFPTDSNVVSPGVDRRGAGGLFVVPSDTSPGREWVDQRDMGAITPGWGGRKEAPRPVSDPEDQYDGPGHGEPAAVALVERLIDRYRDLPWSGQGWNAAFRSAVHTAAGLVASGKLDPTWAEDAVLGACQDPDEAADVFRSSWDHGYARPMRLRVEGDAAQNGSDEAPETVAADADWLDSLDEGQLVEALLAQMTYSVGEILTRKPPAWLVPGFLQEGSTAQLVGPFAGGKSLLTLHWCAQLVRDGRRVLYCASEGLNGFNGRLRALMAEHGLDQDGLDGIAFYKPDIMLTSDESADQLARFVDLTGPWDLIVIDTLARAIAGAEENAAGEMSAAIKRAERSKHGKATILLVHHAGWSGARGRGSTAIPSAQDNIVHCFPAGEDFDGKDGKPLVIKVASEKLKDGRPSTPVWYEAKETDLGSLDDGSRWTSVALVEVPEPVVGRSNELLDLLRDAGPLTRRDVQDRLGVSSATARRRLAEAIDNGWATRIGEDNSPTATYRLGGEQVQGA